MLDGCVAWPEGFAQRYRSQGYWEDITLFDLLSRTAARFPDKLAVVDDARRVACAQLLRDGLTLSTSFANSSEGKDNRKRRHADHPQ